MRPALFLVLIAVAASSAAQGAPQTAAATCRLHEPRSPHPHGFGIVMGIQDPAMARARIAVREAAQGGAIDPRYHDDMRVKVKQDDGHIDYYDVPAGLSVHTGDRVQLQGSTRSRTAPCSYVPHMAIPYEPPVA